VALRQVSRPQSINVPSKRRFKLQQTLIKPQVLWALLSVSLVALPQLQRQHQQWLRQRQPPIVLLVNNRNVVVVLISNAQLMLNLEIWKIR
jgi:hypothetical protein